MADSIGNPFDPQRFRGYLLVLTQMHMTRELRGKLEPADIVQQALLEAHQQVDAFRGRSEPEFIGWLRTILARTIVDATRTATRAKRDVNRERSLEADIDATSKQLHAWLIADQSSPSMRFERQENSVLLSDALARLPDGQREVLVLRHCRGWTFAQIAEHMECTTSTVAGLLARGTDALRAILDETPE